MDWGMLVATLAVFVSTSIVIVYACNSFKGAADYLGRNMAPGTKGATINAIGSSLPELFTTSLMLFGPLVAPSFFGNAEDGFLSGIATCVGSAVFNMAIIPGLCIITVVVYGLKRPDGSREPTQGISLDKKVIIRDGIFFVLAEAALIYFLEDAVMTWWMGSALALIYVVYITYTLKAGFVGGETEPVELEPVEAESNGILGLGWLLDFNQRIYGGAAFNNRTAWTVLSLSTAVVAGACAGIAWAVEHSAEVLGIEPYIAAMILAAAATSVPDTVLSVQDAQQGEYDDAVANAVGSNIFDICVCLGIPVFIYCLIMGDRYFDANTTAEIQVLLWVLAGLTLCVLSLFLMGTHIGKVKASLLVAVYVVWTAFVVGRSQGANWTNMVVKALPGSAGTALIVNTDQSSSDDAKTPAK